MNENYKKYLDFLNKKLEIFYKQQEPYIFCKKGCAKCCKNAHFPYSQTEINYLIDGALLLPNDKLELVTNNILKVLKERKKHKGEIFRYDCPFLINDECCVYEYRGVVCRSFGLMYFDKDNKTKAPFCWELGLNYSNVMEDNGKKVSVEKIKKINAKYEPLAFNISYEFLTNSRFEEEFSFKFGDKKPLIEWFSNYDIK